MSTFFDELKLALFGSPKLRFADCIGKVVLVERAVSSGLFSSTRRLEVVVVRVSKDGQSVKLKSGLEEWWEPVYCLELVEVLSTQEGKP